MQFGKTYNEEATLIVAYFFRLVLKWTILCTFCAGCIQIRGFIFLETYLCRKEQNQEQLLVIKDVQFNMAANG